MKAQDLRICGKHNTYWWADASPKATSNNKVGSSSYGADHYFSSSDEKGYAEKNHTHSDKKLFDSPDFNSL